MSSLDQEALSKYIELLKAGKPRLAAIPDSEIYELMSIKRDNVVTLSSVMNFSPYPQIYITFVKEASQPHDRKASV